MPIDTLTAIVEHPRLFAVPVFADNYVWVLRSGDGTHCLLVDPGDAAPVTARLTAEGLTPDAILVTHHHADHTGGLAALRQGGIPVYGPRHEPIAGVDHPADDGDRIDLPGYDGGFRVLAVPGHTAGHIAFVGSLDDRTLLFCGDTLFSGGCGRLFEGTAGQMYESLARLAALPDDTLVCCTHEYTEANLRFAAAVEPENADLAACRAWARQQRAAGRPTLPGDLARERRINPFLRTAEPAVRNAVALRESSPPATASDTFAILRRWKDGFR
ncbi:MAG: hydroxyacylglutathione hydrolase [Pseudomonadota bacterium]